MFSNIANILTLMRIALIPVLIGLFYIEAPFSFITASLLFLIACLTDYFDGVIARATQQESAIGRFLDPLADKLIIAAALIMLAGFGRIGCQMFGIGFLIVGDALPLFPFETIGLYSFWMAGFLTLITGYDYLKQSLKHLK